ncbi:MAG: hypothetical protein ACAI38_14195 [Myxococcota bacterium]
MKRAHLMLLGIALVGCDDDRGLYDDHQDETVAVIGDNEVTLSGPVGSGDCVQVSDSLCVPVDTEGSWCEREGGPVDVVLVDGVAVEVVCYPPADDEERPTVIVDGATVGDVDVAQNANNTTVVFDDALDGVPFVGNVSVDGNNVSIYGNGPDKTIIDGDVVITGNNVRLRGVTITGNLSITLNSAAVVLSRIHGDVLITKNGTVFVENDVFGAFTSTSNGNLYVGNDVQGAWSITGNGSTCDENNAFADGDADHQIDDGELADPLVCP